MIPITCAIYFPDKSQNVATHTPSDISQAPANQKTVNEVTWGGCPLASLFKNPQKKAPSLKNQNTTRVLPAPGAYHLFGTYLPLALGAGTCGLGFEIELVKAVGVSVFGWCSRETKCLCCSGGVSVFGCLASLFFLEKQPTLKKGNPIVDPRRSGLQRSLGSWHEPDCPWIAALGSGPLKTQSPLIAGSARMAVKGKANPYHCGWTTSCST